MIQSESSSSEDDDAEMRISLSDDEPDEPYFSILVNADVLQGQDVQEFAGWKGVDQVGRQFTVLAQHRFFDRVLQVGSIRVWSAEPGAFKCKLTSRGNSFRC